MPRFLILGLMFFVSTFLGLTSTANAAPQKIELSFETAFSGKCKHLKIISFLGKTILVEDKSTICRGIDVGLENAGYEFRMNKEITVDRSCVHRTRDRTCDDGTHIKSPRDWEPGNSTENIVAIAALNGDTLKLKYQSEIEFVRLNRRKKHEFNSTFFYEIRIEENSCTLIAYSDVEHFRGLKVHSSRLKKAVYCRMTP